MKDPKRKPLFVVVDENNRWLVYGPYDSAEDAAKDAKIASNFDQDAGLFVFRVSREWRSDGIPNARLKPYKRSV